MTPLARFDIVIAIAVAAALVAASLGGLPRILGAHPWWAQQTGIIGSIGGAALWLILRRVGVPVALLLITAALTFAASIAAVHFGKQVFAASFAENALAGRFWYLGWYALAGSTALLIATLAALALRR